MLRIGLVGYGGFGRFLHRVWNDCDFAHVTAVSDVTDPLPFGAPADFFRDWRDLVASDRVDLVAIATPPHTHSEMACNVMHAGKHVLVEKPLALSLAEAQRIIAVRDETGRVAGVDFMLRFNPIVEWVGRTVSSGAFGKLRRVLVENHAQDESLRSGHWFWDPARSGGILVEHAGHFIDLVQSWAGVSPVHISGTRSNREDGRTDRVFASVGYAEGLLSTQYHAFARPNLFEKTRMVLNFDLADVSVDGWIPTCGSIDALVNCDSEAVVRALPGFRYESESQLHSGDSGGRLSSGGIPYSVTHRLGGSFDLKQPKETVYAACLQSLLSDLYHSIRDPSHRQRVTLENALESLRIALAARDSASETICD